MNEAEKEAAYQNIIEEHVGHGKENAKEFIAQYNGGE